MLGPQSLNASQSYPLVLNGYQGASLAGVFTGAETFSAKLWAGDDQAVSATLTAAWDTTISGNPSTVTSPTIKLTVSTSVISSLGPGDYFYQVLINPGSDNLEAARGRIRLRLAPGSANVLPTYCSIQDMTRICSWIEEFEDDEDCSAFLEQRADAREWFENILFAHDRGVVDRAWFEGGWITPAISRSTWLKQRLAGNNITALTITNQGSGYTIPPLVTISGIGNAASAVATIAGGVVTGLTITNNGYGYVGGATVSFTSQDAGTGAAATATVTGTGCLLLNPDVVRANAMFAVGSVLRHQVGHRDGTPFMSLGREFISAAESLSKTIVAELDTNGDGIPDYVIDLTTLKVRFA